MKYMDEVHKGDLRLAKKDVLLHLLILVGALSLLLSIISCSSHNPEDEATPKTTVGGNNLQSVKINGVKISVGETADTVYSQIGRGILTVATNDPADKNSIIIVHSYLTEGKTYRVSFCKDMKQYYHVCKISLVELSPKTRFDLQSDANRRMRRDSINNKRSSPKIITNDELKKDE
jgi:hypothetical protein